MQIFAPDPVFVLIYPHIESGPAASISRPRGPPNLNWPGVVRVVAVNPPPRPPT